MRKILCITLVGSKEQIARVELMFKMVETFNRLDIEPDTAFFHTASLLNQKSE